MTKNKPDIGIVTFWNTVDNYGCVLQCYALQQALIQSGGNPFLIKYDHTQISKKRIIFHWLSILFSFQLHRVVKYIIREIFTKPIDRGFDKFRETYIKSTEHVYSITELKNNFPSADYYVCGSDQIWSQSVYDEGYFLDWGEKHIPRIAYAASFGKFIPSGDFIAQIAQALKKFQVVTVREYSGVNICQKAGICNPRCVPDPTLLLSAKDYEKLMVEKLSVKDDYLLVYLIGWNTDINFEDIECFAEQKGLEIKFVASQCENAKYDSKLPKTYPSIQEWLSLMANARYILTNSFHGTAFSIIFNRKFGVYPLKGKSAGMNERIYTLLDSFGLNNRIVSRNLQILDMQIDYVLVNMTLKTQRETIRNYFKEWFNINNQ
jgi:hypothetical protein